MSNSYDIGSSVRPKRFGKYLVKSAVLGLYVRTLRTTPPNFNKFLCMFVGCALGSVLLWWRCDTLCTSGFVDNDIFSHNGSYGAS